jgi:hypothetical protein
MVNSAHHLFCHGNVSPVWKHQPPAHEKQMSVLKEVFLLTIGWILLGVLGALRTLLSLPQFALIAVASIGIIASLRGFGGCEMLLTMIFASIVGGLLMHFST